MNRRVFIGALTALSGLSLDPEKAAWRKSKTISIPSGRELFHLGVDMQMPSLSWICRVAPNVCAIGDVDDVLIGKNTNSPYHEVYFKLAMISIKSRLDHRLKGDKANFLPLPSVPTERCFMGRIGPFPQARFVQQYDIVRDLMIGRYDIAVQTL